MPRAVKRRMMSGVKVVRDLIQAINGRQVPEHAVLQAVGQIVSAATDLETDIIGPEPVRSVEIVHAVQAAISRQSAEGLRGDASTIASLSDEVTRSILSRQLPTIDRLLLLRAVLDGVEKGLRDLLRIPIGVGPFPRAPPMLHDVVPGGQPAQSIEDPLPPLVGSPGEEMFETDAVTVESRVVVAHDDRNEY